MGMLGDLSSVIDNNSNSPLVSGFDKAFKNELFFGNTYLNVELSYMFNKNKIGYRYNFTETFEQICFKLTDHSGRCSQRLDNPQNHTLLYALKINLSDNFSLYPTTGIGLMYFDIVNLGIYRTSSGTIFKDDGNIEYQAFQNFESRYFLYSPIEINLDYKFNNFLHFDLKLGYQQPIQTNFNSVMINYKLESETKYHQATINNLHRNFYLGISLSFEIPIVKK